MFKKYKAASQYEVIQDADRIRRALAKRCLNASDNIRFTDEMEKFVEHFDLKVIFHFNEHILSIFCLRCLSILCADNYQFIDDHRITLKIILFNLSANVVSQMQQSSEDSVNTINNEMTDMIQKSTQLK
ncbi:unnamed protein product [Rotaria sp. Silwood2]|nr:unnamed protein product [Rotaria sp. Silwood2]